jgi:hypothetical protein
VEVDTIERRKKIERKKKKKKKDVSHGCGFDTI